MFYLLGFFVPIAAFFFEAYPRFINRRYGVDVWTHLLYLQEYKKQGGIPKKIDSGFLVPGRYDYPPAFIFIMSKFPLDMVENYEFLFSPFFDALHMVLIFFVINMFSGNVLLAITTQLLYVLTPLIVIENSSATPRSLGYTFFTITFLLLFAYYAQGVFAYFLLASFFGMLIFLSHRFTAQGFLFFSIFFSIADRSISFFSCFMLSFTLAVVFSRGFYLIVLKGHIGNLVFWYKNIGYRFAHQIKGNQSSAKTKDFVFKIYNQFLKFPPFVLTITNPWTLPAAYLIFYIRPHDFILTQFAMWAGFSYVLALLTIWIPQLRFLGEGQRYLELSAFPFAFLAAFLLFGGLNTSDNYIYIILYCLLGAGAVVTITVIQRKAIIKETLRTLTPDMMKMFAYLKNLKQKPRLLCIPHQITTNTIYHTGCPVFVNADYATIQKISDVYPYLRKPLPEIMKQYKLDYVLLNEEYATIKDLRLHKYRVIKRIANFVLLDPEK